MTVSSTLEVTENMKFNLVLVLGHLLLIFVSVRKLLIGQIIVVSNRRISSTSDQTDYDMSYSYKYLKDYLKFMAASSCILIITLRVSNQLLS